MSDLASIYSLHDRLYSQEESSYLHVFNEWVECNIGFRFPVGAGKGRIDHDRYSSLDNSDEAGLYGLMEPEGITARAFGPASHPLGSRLVRQKILVAWFEVNSILCKYRVRGVVSR